ncbi:sugar (glycoside-pentoside-hexuronide) transporter [Pseudoduganella flava]|uniref:MFS transporter n=1 Tax=Pseudoduganella flava TaxID=871742 RepID=A0A562Q1Q9_9BURK|nr:glycoside-pentoside-hexuronide (GPH):cation symporter [Pseudoduganella flava]QGZ38096.1 MFS transporter [Pseudoduganella flava]TWI50390.1 sugar (glycoside-pentoside-hexuronide) transporter [Pseudoduganella flava]
MTNTTDSANARLSVTEKVGYCLGDLAANLIFQTLLTFIAFYYTDVFKISANAAATIIFAGGIVGACFNPIMGLIADRTATRWGKFRPWILWTAVPFGLVAILAFSTPDFGNQGKIIYATLTYVLLMLIYSANNLPYSALSGVLTGSMSERNSLSSYRFVAVMVAQFIIQVLLLPLVLILGGGDKVAGFQNTMIVFAIAGTVCFLITFFTTRERIVPTAEQRSSIGQDIADLLRNKPWVVMLVVTILVFVTLALKGGMYIYYFRSYLSAPHLAAFLQDVGFNGFIAGLNGALAGMGLTAFQWPEDAPTSAFSVFNAIGIVMMIIGIGFSRPLADRFGKREVFGIALFISTLFMLAFYFYAPTSIGIVFLSQLLHGFFYGVTIPLLWAMIADVADYSEWKNNRRATALLFSAMIFGLKAGLSTGGALVAALLSGFGYDAALTTQAPRVVDGIRLAVSVYAGIPFLLAVACLAFYEIRKSTERTIEHELGLRRAAAQR